MGVYSMIGLQGIHFELNQTSLDTLLHARLSRWPQLDHLAGATPCQVLDCGDISLRRGLFWIKLNVRRITLVDREIHKENVFGPFGSSSFWLSLQL